MRSSRDRIATGYRVWPTHRFLAKDNIRRFRRRVRWLKGAYAKGELSSADVTCRLMSWLGHAGQANSVRLIERLAEEWVFQRDQ